MIRITGGTDTAVGSLFAGSQGEALRREAERLFATIRTAGLVENEPGVSRDSYGFRESGAMMTVASAAEKHGLSTWYDAAGNLWVGLPGDEADAPGAMPRSVQR